MILVARDHDNVRKAVLELLLEPTVDADNQKIREQVRGAANEEKVLAEMKPSRSLAEGYYARAHYLLWLLRRTRVISFRPEQLTADDVDGLLAVQAAVQEFERSNWQCPYCLVWISRDNQQCTKCGFDPRRKE